MHLTIAHVGLTIRGGLEEGCWGVAFSCECRCRCPTLESAALGFCRPPALTGAASPWQLEKKFSGKHVVIIGQRRIMRKPSAGQRQPKQKRPRSRTLTAVHESILEDLVYPTEIVGKHTRYRLDGSKIIKVYLDPKEAANVEYKVDTFATVYKRLTGKEVKL